MPRRRPPPQPPRPDLTVPVILAWADEFHERYHRWPHRKDGARCLPDTTWSAVDGCLKSGARGLPPGSSLAKVLLEHRGRRHRNFLAPLTPERVLGWADAYFARTGDWPTQNSGPVADAPGETWSGVNTGLLEGLRGATPGGSLARLLAEHRGVRNHYDLPKLTEDQILTWADAHFARTGDWPGQLSGPIPEAPGEGWGAVCQALYVGVRGLPGGNSLARLLAAARGVRNSADLPRLEVWEILLWADDHRERTGEWPTADAGPVAAAPGEAWGAIDSSLWAGTRGLPGGDSLHRLLAARRGAGGRGDRPDLTERQILDWAETHRRRTGDWPTAESGPVFGADRETWKGVSRALHRGLRGLPGGSSLARLLGVRRGARSSSLAPALTEPQILTWADAHFARTGDWPTRQSGAVAGAGPGETWSKVDYALADGGRGLSPGGSLRRLLARHRGARNHMALPPFTTATVLAWADAHRARTGGWPTRTTGPIPEAAGETWKTVEQALRAGLRGLPGGDSLSQLLARERGHRNRKALPPLTPRKIAAWVRAHRRRTASWPTRDGGPIPDAPGETWGAVDQALYKGIRGLPGGASLPQFVAEIRAGGRG